VITDLGDGIKPGKVNGLYIGDELCTRTGINQPAIKGNLNETIKCKVSLNQEAGRYSVKEHVEPGIAQKPQKLQKTSIFGNPYEFVVLPTVTEVSPTNGSVSGAKMIIKGSGFPSCNNEKDKIKVTIDNTSCDIVQTSTNEIKCNLKKKSNSSSKIVNSANTSAETYVSGSGFRYRRYSILASSIEAFEAI
jgi:hypothetical protein